MNHHRKNFTHITLCILLPTVFFAQAGWGPDVRLTFDYAYNADPRATSYGDTIHLVWWKNYIDSLSIMHDEVFYVRSTDAGETWEADMRLSVEDDNASVQPTIGVNDTFVHVVWKDEHAGVIYRKSSDGGNTWLQVDTLPDAGLSEPWIHVDKSFLYVVSGAATGFQVFTKSTDNGATWQTGQNIIHSCGAGRIKKLDTLMLVFSHQDDPYSIEIYCLRSTDEGQTWFDTTCVSQYDSVSGQRPAMDIDDSTGIHVTWYDYKYSPYPWTGDIFYRTSRDSGNTWESIDSLTTQHRALVSDILAEGNNLHLVWDDDRNGFGENNEVYYRMSTDLGQTWGNEMRLTNAPYKSICPSLTCGGGYLHLFWSDLRDYGNNQPWMLYYKRKDLSQGVTEIEQGIPSTSRIFEVYPTLCTGSITLIRHSAWGKEQREKKYITDNNPIHYALCTRVFDITGKKVIEETKIEIEKGGFEETMQIETKGLPCGVYFVEVRINNIYETHKVIKIR